MCVEIIASQGPYPLLGYKAQKNNLNFQLNKRKIHTRHRSLFSALVVSSDLGELGNVAQRGHKYPTSIGSVALWGLESLGGQGEGLWSPTPEP